MARVGGYMATGTGPHDPWRAKVDGRMTDPITALSFDTALLPEAAAFPAWQSALANFDLSRTENGPFRARAQIWLLSPMVLVHAEVDAIRYDREERRLKQDSNDHFALVQLVSGEFVGDFGRGEVRAGPGSLTVLDTRRSCWTDASRLEAFVLSMPRAFLAPALGELDPHGMVVAGGLVDLCGTLLAQLRGLLGTMGREQAPIIARLIRELVAETLLDAGRLDPLRCPVREDPLVTRVRTHVDQHLGETLDIESICAAVGASRSTLYRAFGGGGGVQQQVLRRRLQAMRLHLDDAEDARPIALIARGVGLIDKSHATRAFKREFGFTPGEYRRLGADGVLSARMDDVPQIFERLTALLD